MRWAYKQGDLTRAPIETTDFLRQEKPGIAVQKACCLACDQVLTARAAGSDRVAHFAHAPGATCPTIAKSHVAFSTLQSIPFDPATAAALTQFVATNVHGVYEATRKLVPGLSQSEFLELLSEAAKKRMWELRGLQPEYLSYFLVCCANSFPAKPKFKRLHPLFFVLDTQAGTDTYWNLPTKNARYISRVEVTSVGKPNIVEQVPVTPSDAKSWLEREAKKLLPVKILQRL